MLLKALVNNPGAAAADTPQMPGDVLDTCEQVPLVVDETAGGVTLTGDQVARGDIELSGNAGAVATTLPTADQLCASLKGAFNTVVPPTNSPFGANVAPEMQWPANLGAIPPQTTFRRMFRNLNGAGNNTITAPASAGVTVSGTATLATNTWREYLITIVQSAPTVVIGATTTNANAVLTNLDKNLIKQVAVGQSVYGTGIAASTTVRAVNYDLGTVTLSANATATANNIAITFTPTVTWTNLRSGTV